MALIVVVLMLIAQNPSLVAFDRGGAHLLCGLENHAALGAH
jgi:hypothetical protein